MSYILPEYCPPRAPKLDWHKLPEQEYEIGQSVQSNLEALEATCYAITTSIHLYHRCSEEVSALLSVSSGNSQHPNQSIFWHGRSIHARSCALCLRDYLHALRKTRTLPGRVTGWQGRYDAKSLKALEMRYMEKYPNIDKVRHAAAHPETYSNPAENNKVFEIHEPGIDLVSNIPIQVRNSQFWDFYVFTFDDQVVKFDITGATVAFVVETTRLAFSAFSGLDTSCNQSPC